MSTMSKFMALLFAVLMATSMIAMPAMYLF